MTSCGAPAVRTELGELFLPLEGHIDPAAEKTRLTKEAEKIAIEIAKVNEPSEPDQWSTEALNVGLRRDDWVSVTPDDYGNPVYGSILAWTPDEIVIRHEDPSVGKVNLRFPRVGFDAAPAQRQAA